jgi:uncharacterized protein
MCRFFFLGLFLTFSICHAQEDLFELFASGTPEMITEWLEESPRDLNAAITKEIEETVYLTTPLIIVAERNPHPEVVKLLIDAGADVNVKSQNLPWTPLTASVKNKNIAIMKLLLASGADVIEQGGEALRGAAIEGNLEATNLLLEMNVNIDVGLTYGSPLFLSLQYKHFQITKVLLEAGATVNTDDYLWAARNLESFEMFQNAVPLDRKLAEQILLSGGIDERLIPILLSMGLDANVRDESGYTPLMRGASWQYIEGIKILLAAGAEINATSKIGETVLISGAYGCFGANRDKRETIQHALEAIKLLLEAGADVNAQTFPEPYIERTHPRQVIRVGLITTLMNAVNCPNEIVQVLLDAGANINAVDQDGETALMKARPESFDVFLQNGADVNIQDNRGGTVLMRVTQYSGGYYGDQAGILLEKLLAYGANVNLKDNDGLTVLFYALYECKPEMFYRLRDAGGDLKAQTNEGETLLMYAANFCPEIVQDLIDAGLNVNAKAVNGCAPLTYAYSARATQLLLSSGADVRAFGGQALIEAMKKDNISRITVLVQAGADVNYVSNEADWFSVYNLPLIVYAVQQNNIELIKLLAKHGANLEARDDSGHTALHWAGLTYNKCTRGFSIATSEMIRVLVDAGADVNARVLPVSGDKYYCQELSNVLDTPLIQASKRGDVESIQFLLNAGADISAKDENGWTALDFAVQTGQEEIVKVLLEASQQ